MKKSVLLFLFIISIINNACKKIETSSEPLVFDNFMVFKDANEGGDFFERNTNYNVDSIYYLNSN